MKKSCIVLLLLWLCATDIRAQRLPDETETNVYVAVNGDDGYRGTLSKPYRTIAFALRQVAGTRAKHVNILIRGGDYRFDKALEIDPALLTDHSLTIAAYKNEKPVIRGSREIKPVWKPYRDNILQSFVGMDLAIDQLYCNGKVLPMARYPDYDSTQRVFNGTAADAISTERVRKWKDPRGGYVHALHQGEWGGFHYLITGVDAKGELALSGGWQNNRPAPMHASYRFVENIFEELDAPGEWYYNKQQGILYVYPSRGIDTSSALWETSSTDELMIIKSSMGQPIKNVSVKGIAFTETNRTFMKTREPLLRSDWTVFRGGAILIDGGDHISISDCRFDGLGGNAIFISNYNRNIVIEGNTISNIGASAVSFAGNPLAVRSPSFQYDQHVAFDTMDMKPGPASPDYPSLCTVYNNLIHDIGKIEKQVAGVEIAMSSEITVSHNTIYNVPRSGINIGDGCWGGHIIEFNDVFNTVLETGDHGAFNSWGRDRYWLPDIKTVDTAVKQRASLPFLDAWKPVILRNNRFQCNHGWDIDLDDGSTNYHIYNNLCLNGGLKLREGYNRIVENNIIVNNSFHPHVWYAESRDVFRYNIVFADYAPIGITVWGSEVDHNFFILKRSLEDAQRNGTDQHSLSGDPHFINPSSGNYTVSTNASVFKTGFRNFPMDKFGVVSAALKSKAAKTPLPSANAIRELARGAKTDWMGIEIKNIEGLGERSAAGLFDENGILLVKVPQGTLPAKSGLKPGDVIRSVNDKPVIEVNDLLAAIQVVMWQGMAKLMVIRNQKEQEITLLLK